jgi:uncharacterized protein YceH (UPF0502 family)
MSDASTNLPEQPEEPQPAKPRWVPLSATDRRVIGVLVEKAKTTPEAYPMSGNAIVTGSNQKSNRAPMMQLTLEQVDESLDRLRQLGAVGLIEGYGRVPKYRHYLYEWMGIDKVELAVMAELLLRGDQTVGELRARASRMELIADLAALRPTLESLRAKGLIVYLTPEGRGHVVTHALYRPQELERVKAQYGPGRPQPVALGDEDATPPQSAAMPVSSAVGPPAAAPAGGGLQREVAELRAQVVQLRGELENLGVEFQRLQDEFRRLQTELGS